ncbi:hypothetical protein V5N11_003272 [Cardamine amara subsp. amara]|uniref:Uncharacterized protein n=1 Tax=Cardamine amara subsp. amara TaxID=228776 RepID=A0ABD1BTQ5_CARAN
MLKDAQGREQFLEGSKGNVAVEYFKELFSSTQPQNFEDFLEGLPPRVTETMNASLTAPVYTEEIKKAAFGIKGGSSVYSGCFTDIFTNVVGALLVLALFRRFKVSFAHQFFLQNGITLRFFCYQR